MRFTSSVVAAAVGMFLVGPARAESPIPSNYVDDFGSLTPTTSSASPAATGNAHSSPIPSNYIDDFGSLTPTTVSDERPKALAAGHSSPVPLNFIDDFGVDQETSAETSQAIANVQPTTPSSSIPRS